MKKLLVAILFISAGIGVNQTVTAQIYEPEGINTPGAWNGWTNSNDSETMGNFRQSYRSFAGGQYLSTVNIQSSGGDTTAGTYEMLFTSGPDGNTYANKWADGGSLNIDGFTSFTYNGSANNSITVTNGNYYTLIFDDNGYANSTVAVLKTSAEPISISSVSGIPDTAVTENDPVTITVELSAAKSSEEKIYIRYSNDGFQTSDAVEVSNFSGGTTGTADIPGQALNSSVEFYVLSTTIDKVNWDGKIDLATISYDNNSGNNYSYFYDATIDPLNNEKDVSLTPELTWFSISDTSLYDLQLDDDSDFSSPVIDEENLTDTTFTISTTLESNTRYYWRFRDTTETSWTYTYSFVTVSEITFANIQFPSSSVFDEGSTATIYGQVTVPDVTSVSGADADLEVWFGLNDSNTDPSAWAEMNWETASFNEDKLSTDEYTFTTDSGLEPGHYYYAFRYRYKDQDYVYGGLNGEWDGITNTSGELVVMDIPELNSPADAATDISVMPDLSWTATDAGIQEFNLQVAAESGFSSPIIDEANLPSSGTSYSVSSSFDNETTYYWRVRSEYDTTASAWSETFSFTTEAGLPSKITLNSPADGASDIAIEPTFSWTADPNSGTYQIQISSSNDFSGSLVFDRDSISATQYVITDEDLLISASTYYWRVQGLNEEGTGDWSDTRSFTTIKSVPELISPADGASDIAIDEAFEWNQINGALNYDIQISTVSDFTAMVVDSAAHPDTSFVADSLQLETPYFWRVKANYSAGSSEWSVTRSFTTVAPPPLVPVLIDPDSASSDIGLQPILSWQASVDAESYNLQLATSSDLNSGIVVDSSGISGTEFQTKDLSRATTYYWRVRAYNSEGGFGDWSTIYPFTTIPEIPDAPELVSPADSSAFLGSPVTFTWNTADGANHYLFQYSETSDFTFSADSALTDTVLTISGFQSAHTYFWRVRSSNTGGNSGWSSVRTFTTGLAGYDGPGLISPEHKAFDTDTALTFAWKALTGAASYQLQVSDSSHFNSTLIDSSGIEDAILDLSGFDIASTYFWRVRAMDTNGSSEWSTVGQFMTRGSSPLVPVIVSPADSASDQPRNITYTWRPSVGAASYELRFSDQEDLSVSLDSTGITDTLLTIHSLAQNTRYYWQLRAVNTYGSSEWTALHTFTTGLDLPATPVLITPEEEDITELSVRFAWNGVANTESYQFQLAETDSFKVLLVDSSLTVLTIEVDDLTEQTTYYWRVRSYNRAGNSFWSDTLSFTTMMITDIEQEGLPTEFGLNQNYPNPFNPSTVISYQLPVGSRVELKVFDMLGREVAVLVNERRPAGEHAVTFNAHGFASGIYLYQLNAGEKVFTKRLTLIK